MPTLRKPATAPPDARYCFTLDEILDGQRPGRVTPARDAEWLALRRELHEAAYRLGFDPRAVLSVLGDDRERWITRRLAALADRFRDDPRVEAA